MLLVAALLLIFYLEPVRDFDFSFLSAVDLGLACDFGSNVDGHRFLAVFLAFDA